MNKIEKRKFCSSGAYTHRNRILFFKHPVSRTCCIPGLGLAGRQTKKQSLDSLVPASRHGGWAAWTMPGQLCCKKSVWGTGMPSFGSLASTLSQARAHTSVLVLLSISSLYSRSFKDAVSLLLWPSLERGTLGSSPA